MNVPRGFESGFEVGNGKAERLAENQAWRAPKGIQAGSFTKLLVSYGTWSRFWLKFEPRTPVLGPRQTHIHLWSTLHLT